MDHFVYIIKSSSTKKVYTGITNNLQRRLSEHNRAKSNSVVTKHLTDFEIIYSEKLPSRVKARIREKYLKSGTGREFRKKIVNG